MNKIFLKKHERKIRQALLDQPQMTLEEFLKQASTTTDNGTVTVLKPSKKEEVTMATTIDDIRSCTDLTDTIGLHYSITNNQALMLVIVKSGINFESIVKDYAEWFVTSFEKYNDILEPKWYRQYPKGNCFAVVPITPNMKQVASIM